MRIYLDACCLGRLTDDQSQQRIRDESASVEFILGKIRMNIFDWIASEALMDELRRIPSRERRIEAESLLSLVTQTVQIDDRIEGRARELTTLGYGVYDGLHLAAAESAQVQVLLSTDDRFVKRAARGIGTPQVQVRNPVSWFQEQPS